MKLFKLFPMLLLSLGLALGSCQSEDDGPDPGGGEGTESGYFSLNFQDLGTIPTKALVEDPGLEDESNITSIRVILYGAASGVPEYVKDYTVTSAWNGSSGSDITGTGLITGANTETGIKTEAEKILIKNYKLLVLLNPTAEVADLTKVGSSTTFQNFKGTKISTVSNPAPTLTAGEEYKYFTGSAMDNFMMGNFQEFINIQPKDFYKTTTEAEDNPVDVYVERAVAKVFVSGPDVDDPTNLTNVVLPEGASISTPAWKLDITNKDSYLIRNMTRDNNGDAERTNPAWSVPNRHRFYAGDVNMDGISRERYPDPLDPYPGNEDEPNVIFNYFTDVTLVDQELGTYEYALENTMEAEEQYEDVTTAVIIGLVYNPGRSAVYGEEFPEGSGRVLTDGEILTGSGYFVWTYRAGTEFATKYVFTGKDLDQIKALDLSSDPAIIGAFPEFEALHDFLNNSESGWDVFVPSGAAFADYGGGVDSYLDEENMMAYHTPGTNYYRVPIRHFDDSLQPEPMAWGRFGIVRNNVYKLSLKAVNGPGDITIPEPQGPDDKTGYLSLEIKVLPWVVRTQDVGV